MIAFYFYCCILVFKIFNFKEEVVLKPNTPRTEPVNSHSSRREKLKSSPKDNEEDNEVSPHTNYDPNKIFHMDPARTPGDDPSNWTGNYMAHST
jgi:hypothetical protein